LREESAFLAGDTELSGNSKFLLFAALIVRMTKEIAFIRDSPTAAGVLPWRNKTGQSPLKPLRNRLILQSDLEF